MAVGLSPPVELLPIAGIRLGVTCAGIKHTDRADLAVIECSADTTVAAVFTKNKFCAAPVNIARQHVAAGPRALVINSGNANAGTGDEGDADALAVCAAVAKEIGCDQTQVLPFSTGVISQRLPLARVVDAVPRAVTALGADNWLPAAAAIMTTDTVAKGTSRQFGLDGETITVTGIVKGSGMIRPDMATMLCFVALDAPVAAPVLQHALARAMEISFHRITVDGDTSTNDACVLLATGNDGVRSIDSADDPRYRTLQVCLNDVFTHLAQAVIRDGEGATKFVQIEIQAAASAEDARRVGFTIAHSPLVKTALFASDPNLGRILAAIGRAGVENLDVSRIGLRINEVEVMIAGVQAESYSENRGQDAMAAEEIHIVVDLDMGEVSDRVWTCDLSYDYVRINAEYRT